MKNKNVFFFICQRVWKTVKSQGKIREKSGNFEVDDKWQPCTLVKPHREMIKVMLANTMTEFCCFNFYKE